MGCNYVSTLITQIKINPRNIKRYGLACRDISLGQGARSPEEYGIRE
jgi:hypothetical protein